MNTTITKVLSTKELNKKYNTQLVQWKAVYGDVFGVNDEYYPEIFNRYMDISELCIECKKPFKSTRTKLLAKKKEFDYKKESNVCGFICRKCSSTQNKGSIKLHMLPNLPFEVSPIYRHVTRNNWMEIGKAFFENAEQFEQLFIRYCYSDKCGYSGEPFKSRRERCAIFDKGIQGKYNFIGFVKHSNIVKYRTKMQIQ